MSSSHYGFQGRNQLEEAFEQNVIWITNIDQMTIQYTQQGRWENTCQYEEYSLTKCYHATITHANGRADRLSNAPLGGFPVGKEENDTSTYLLRCKRGPCPIERNVEVDLSTSYTSSRRGHNLPQGARNFSLESVQELEPQKSTSVFDKIGPSTPRNRPQQLLPIQREQRPTIKARNLRESLRLEIGERRDVANLRNQAETLQPP